MIMVSRMVYKRCTHALVDSFTEGSSSLMLTAIVLYATLNCCRLYSSVTHRLLKVSRLNSLEDVGQVELPNLIGLPYNCGSRLSFLNVLTMTIERSTVKSSYVLLVNHKAVCLFLVRLTMNSGKCIVYY
jgi:hypothetical protein